MRTRGRRVQSRSYLADVLYGLPLTVSRYAKGFNRFQQQCMVNALTKKKNTRALAPTKPNSTASDLPVFVYKPPKQNYACTGGTPQNLFCTVHKPPKQNHACTGGTPRFILQDQSVNRSIVGILW